MNRRIAVAALLVLVLFPVAKAVKRWRNPETPYSRIASELPADCNGDVLVAHLSPMSYYPVLHYRRNDGIPEKILCAKSKDGYEVSYNLKGGMLTKEDLIEVGASLDRYRYLWLVIDAIDKDNSISEAYDSIKNDKSLVLEAVEQVIGLRVERYRVVDKSD